MKKLLSLLIAVMLLLAVSGCQRKLSGTDELIEYARTELPIAEADTVDLAYAGMCAKGDLALIWFISGSEYQSHYYLPMECRIVGIDEYTFVRTYKPIERLNDCAVLEWQGGYCFLVNNAECSVLKITDSSGTHEIEIEKDVYPSIYFNELLASEYVFLDESGEELR